MDHSIEENRVLEIRPSFTPFDASRPGWATTSLPARLARATLGNRHGPWVGRSSMTGEHRRILEDDPATLFERWYGKPLAVLKEELPNGDGGFVVLATCCFLYERYAHAAIRAAKDRALKARQRPPDTTLEEQLASDFGTDVSTASAFWTVIRHGFLHSGMPMQRTQKGSLPPWMTGDFPRPFQVQPIDGTNTLCVEPWRFRDRVLDLYRTRPELIECNKSFPWASVFSRA